MKLWLFNAITSSSASNCASCRSLKASGGTSAFAPQAPSSPLQSCNTNIVLEIPGKKPAIMGDEKQENENGTNEEAATGAGATADVLSQDEQQKAAKTIQRNYRGYRERRQMKGMGMSASARWSEALKEMKYRDWTRPTSREQDQAVGDAHARARHNWHRLGAIAGRAAADDTDDAESDDGSVSEDAAERKKRSAEARIERQKHAKQMDLQYWLEMVDQKHRYGSHLRTYHEAWQKANTNENFFYWLDHGEGKHLSLPIVSREKLDADQVRYLSREERQNYLVRIDKEGRLCWAHNGVRITTSTAYKDSVDGIVAREDMEHKPWAYPVEEVGAFSSDESETMSTGELDDSEGQHYVNHDLKNAKGIKKLKHVSAATILNHLLQKSVKPNSWIFVADTSFRLYVGIKQSGSFQHSSFLHGSRISAAGLIKIKEGQLRKLSPLSGHYRPPTKNFRLFVHALKDAGVDMSRVSISQSYAILVGLEAYVRTRRKFKKGVKHAEHGAEKVVRPEEAKAREEEEMDKSESAKKERQFLERQETIEKEKKRKNSLPYRIFNKFRTRTTSNSKVEQLKHPTTDAKSGGASAPKSSAQEDPESGIAPDGKR